jgi:hypothetical protein
MPLSTPGAVGGKLAGPPPSTEGIAGGPTAGDGGTDVAVGVVIDGIVVAVAVVVVTATLVGAGAVVEVVAGSGRVVDTVEGGGRVVAVIVTVGGTVVAVTVVGAEFDFSRDRVLRCLVGDACGLVLPHAVKIEALIMKTASQRALNKLDPLSAGSTPASARPSGSTALSSNPHVRQFPQILKCCCHQPDPSPTSPLITVTLRGLVHPEQGYFS